MSLRFVGIYWIIEFEIFLILKEGLSGIYFKTFLDVLNIILIPPISMLSYLFYTSLLHSERDKPLMINFYIRILSFTGQKWKFGPFLKVSNEH